MKAPYRDSSDRPEHSDLATGRVVETGADGVLIGCALDSMTRIGTMWGKRVVVLPLDELEALQAMLESRATEIARLEALVGAARNVAMRDANIDLRERYAGGDDVELRDHLDRVEGLRQAIHAHDESD